MLKFQEPLSTGNGHGTGQRYRIVSSQQSLESSNSNFDLLIIVNSIIHIASIYSVRSNFWSRALVLCALSAISAYIGAAWTQNDRGERPSSIKSLAKSRFTLWPNSRREGCPLSRTWSRRVQAFGLKSNLKIIHLGALARHRVKAEGQELWSEYSDICGKFKKNKEFKKNRGDV